MKHEEYETEWSTTPWFSLSRSAFWKVAGILVGVQVATGLIAIALSAWLGFDRSLDLIQQTIHARLEELASEVERRAFPPGAGLEKAESLYNLPGPLLIDLSSRFPDPIILLNANGSAIRVVQPNPSVFDARLEPAPLVVTVPQGIKEKLEKGRIIVEVDALNDDSETAWAVAPIYNAANQLIGGLLIQPLTNTIKLELTATNDAFLRSVAVVIALALFTAVLLGAYFTWRIVKPLRDIMQQVESIGSGDYTARVETRAEDEFGRLATAINYMANEVENSVEALRETDKLRRQMIANFGHDLRTPLAALLGYIEETNRYLESDNHDAAFDSLQTAERQGKYLQKLIGDLFELSLLDSAHAPLRKEPIPLAELLTDAANTHRPAMRKDGITFKLTLPLSLPMIQGDGVRLLRILDNLLSNARNHTPPDGVIELKAEVSEQRIRITVSDTGCGIGPEDLQHIFDRYYSGSGPRTRRRRGTGLGLPISWAIARAHGGALEAESELGKGSAFILTLPLSTIETAKAI